MNLIKFLPISSVILSFLTYHHHLLLPFRVSLHFRFGLRLSQLDHIPSLHLARYSLLCLCFMSSCSTSRLLLTNLTFPSSPSPRFSLAFKQSHPSYLLCQSITIFAPDASSEIPFLRCPALCILSRHPSSLRDFDRSFGRHIPHSGILLGRLTASARVLQNKTLHSNLFPHLLTYSYSPAVRRHFELSICILTILLILSSFPSLPYL